MNVSLFADVIGFENLSQALSRPASSLRTAFSIGLLPVDSRIVAGARVFDGHDVSLLAEVLSIEEAV